VEAFISQLAVRRGQRHQGLAQALLVDAFARGREHGAKRSALSTDSRTGALTLYQKVGMEVGDVWVNRATEV
jgi:mycothiol synthase